MPNQDGNVTINFSNDPSKINNINIGEKWNWVARMYEPKQEILDGVWLFPKPQLSTTAI